MKLNRMQELRDSKHATVFLNARNKLAGLKHPGKKDLNALAGYQHLETALLERMDAAYNCLSDAGAKKLDVTLQRLTVASLGDKRTYDLPRNSD